MHSFSFGSTDLSDYELIVNSTNINRLRQELSLVQLQDKNYIFRPKSPPRVIQLGYAVIGSSQSDLASKLESIKGVLHTETESNLVLDSLNDRYFKAILESFEGSYRSPTLYEGEVIFVCPEPRAYDNSETASPHPVNSDPDEFDEAAGGNAIAVPVWKILPSVAVDGEVTLRNDTRDEEIAWTGVLNGTTDYIEVDSELWVVRKNGVVDMSSVAGEFPKLTGGMTNVIRTTGFTDGILTITYRKRYL